MNYNEVFQLAQEKGYNPYDNFLTSVDESFWTSVNPEWYKRDDLLIELTLIQKWLRDEHGLDVEIKNQYTDPKDGRWYYAHILGKGGRQVLPSGLGTSYEQALLQGIYEALKLLP